MTKAKPSFIDSAWKRMRSLTPNPSSLPATLPSKQQLVDLGTNMPLNISTKDASSRWSAFLFAKLLTTPQNKDAVVSDYRDKLAQPPLSSPSYLSALETVVANLFKVGWDKHYEHECKQFVLSNGSTLEKHPASASDWISREEFIQFTTTLVSLPAQAFTDVRKVVPIVDSGKLRLPTLATRWQQLLAPLHHTIYNFLTRTGHVVRGDPIHAVRELFAAAGEVFTSGDYTASTDNLSSLHSKHILRLLRMRSTHIPEQIWDLAEASLTGKLLYKGTLSEQSTGQLMGNYLSFPLLCISNLATLFVPSHEEGFVMLSKKVVKVNGDDIVFRSTKDYAERWKKGLPESGFVLNSVKTQEHKRLFSLNSQLFRAGRKKVKKVWSLIPKGIYQRTNTRDKEDFMLAHAAVVRENIKGANHRDKPRLTRALAGVKVNAIKKTSALTQVGISAREYKSWPARWKEVERMKAYETSFSTVRTQSSGVRLYTKPWSRATKEEKEESPYVLAMGRWSKKERGDRDSNDRFLTRQEWERNKDFFYLKKPIYPGSREKRMVWMVEKQVCNRAAPAFVKQAITHPGTLFPENENHWQSMFYGLHESVISRWKQQDHEPALGWNHYGVDC